MPDGDDEANWADAEEVLARRRPEPAERRTARERQDDRLLRAAVVLAGLVFLLALVLLVVDPPPDPGAERPGWRGITGLVVEGTGLLFLVAAFALRAPRRWVPLTWGNPLRELTSRQRKQLLQQVRGRTLLVPERTRLARHAHAGVRRGLRRRRGPGAPRRRPRAPLPRRAPRPRRLTGALAVPRACGHSALHRHGEEPSWARCWSTSPAVPRRRPRRRSGCWSRRRPSTTGTRCTSSSPGTECN